MNTKSDVVIIGGGLAGLIAAIHLSKKGIPVTVIEKNEYPKHKVCGEYVSNEVLPYLKWLNLDIDSLNPTHINKFEFSLVDGTTINTKLPLGGFGISRYELDFYLYKKAISNGCKIIKDQVESIVYNENEFTISISNGTIIKTTLVLGAYGKRSNIDVTLNRNFIKQKSPWLAVKAHYAVDFPTDLVGLYNFKGGYCGVSKVEKNIVNICYLVQFDAFKSFKNITNFQNLVMSQNPHLESIFAYSQLLFEKPLTISQISFEKKAPIENHILMIGDTAGLIHPLCGNGMAMAIHSAKIASEHILDFLNLKIKSRTELEQKYHSEWNSNFKRRLQTGSILSKVLLKPKLALIMFQLLNVFPFLFNFIIDKTHGKPITIPT